MDKAISIIIPSYNRDHLLRNLLISLNDQTFKNFDAFVGYQGHKTNYQLLKKTARQVKYPLTINFYKDRNLTKIKNDLISKSKSKYILTLDDDVIVSNNLLQVFMKEEHDVEGGLVIENVKLSRFNRLYLFFVEKVFNIKPGFFTLSAELNINFKYAKSGFVDAVKGGNMLFKKDVWQKIGGFDENYSGNAIDEDNDFCINAKNHGFRIYFNKEASVTHLVAEGGTRSSGSKTSPEWYKDFFRNHIYFFFKNFWHKNGLKKIFYLAIFIIYRFRQVFTCVIKYGKFRLAYIMAVKNGVKEGLALYQKYVERS